MFWDSSDKGQYWTQVTSGTVQKWGGNGLSDLNPGNWWPLSLDTPAYQIWVNKKGPVGEPGWKRAVAESPVAIAIRIGPGGLAMVRHADARTWVEVPDIHQMVLSGMSFRHYHGWSPLPAEHPLAKADYTQDRFLYRNGDFPPPTVNHNAEDIARWVETGETTKGRVWREHHERQAEAVVCRNGAPESGTNG